MNVRAHEEEFGCSYCDSLEVDVVEDFTVEYGPTVITRCRGCGRTYGHVATDADGLAIVLLEDRLLPPVPPQKKRGRGGLIGPPPSGPPPTEL